MWAAQAVVEQCSEEMSLRVMAMFLVGVVIGAIIASVLAGLDDCGGAVWSPVRYYRLLGRMQDSPSAMLSPELMAQVRGSRRELLGGTAVAVLTRGAYAYGGSPAALKALAGSQRVLQLGQRASEVHEFGQDGRRVRQVRRVPAIQQFARCFPEQRYDQVMLPAPEPLEVD